jgi:hypothetical protein
LNGLWSEAGNGDPQHNYGCILEHLGGRPPKNFAFGAQPVFPIVAQKFAALLEVVEGPMPDLLQVVIRLPQESG